jgi:stress response protein YsnF
MTDARTGDTDPNADEAGPSMTLAEEELVINTVLVETGRVRLRKRVQVETVTRTFELRREVLEIEHLDRLPGAERDPSEEGGEAGAAVPAVLQDGPLAPGSLREATVEILLMQEEAVVTTQLVPRERVRLTKRVVTEDHTVDADLASERADLEERPL